MTMARTAATDIPSRRHHELSRRSLRLRAPPVPPPTPSTVASGLPLGFGSTRNTKQTRTRVSKTPEESLLLLWLLLLLYCESLLPFTNPLRQLM